MLDLTGFEPATWRLTVDVVPPAFASLYPRRVFLSVLPLPGRGEFLARGHFIKAFSDLDLVDFVSPELWS